MSLMVSDANFFSSQTALPNGPTLSGTDVQAGSHVGPYMPKDFGGSLLTEHYRFGFGWGHLATFSKRGFMPQDSAKGVKGRNLELAQFTSLIDTNSAYVLATNWLSAIGVDVRAMEKKYRLNLNQWRYYTEGTIEGKTTMLPVFNVEWIGHILRTQTNRESVVVRVTIFGATKELVNYLVLDDSLFVRPRIAIKDAEKLLAIPDEEFRKYDSVQRSNLVVKFDARGTFGADLSMPTPQTRNSANSNASPKISRAEPKPIPSVKSIHRVLPP